MSIERGMSVLRTIASGGAAGMKAGEIANSLGVHRVSVHRLLAELLEKETGDTVPRIITWIARITRKPRKCGAGFSEARLTPPPRVSR